jgi:ubiquitin
LLTDLEERLATCEADLKNEKQAHEATRKSAELALRDRNEALRDIETRDMDCHELKQQMEEYHSLYTGALLSRNAALQERDQLQDILRSKLQEVKKLQKQVQVLEKEKNDKRALADDGITNSQSNIKKTAETFKQKYLRQKQQVCDLKLLVAKLEDQLQTVNKKCSRLTAYDHDDHDCDLGTFIECPKKALLNDNAFTDDSFRHLVNINCFKGFGSIKVAGLSIIVPNMADSSHQGKLQEGDVIVEVNDVSLEHSLSEYLNILMTGETDWLKMQVLRHPQPSLPMPRYTSSASGNSVSTQMMSSHASKASSVSVGTSVSSCDQRRKRLWLQLPLTKENDLSLSIRSLPEADLCSNTGSQEGMRRKSVVKNGRISMTVLQRDSEDTLQSLSRSVSDIYEASRSSTRQPQFLSSRMPRRSLTYPSSSRGPFASSQITGQKLSDMSFGALSPHPPKSPLLRQQMKSRQLIQSQQDSTDSTTAVVRTVTVVAHKCSPAVEIVGGYGRGVFVKTVCGFVEKGVLKKGDQILQIGTTDFSRVTHAQAVQATKGQVNVQVVHNRSEYDDIIESDVGHQDSFYVRALFSYTKEGQDDIEFEPGTIFHVTKTSLSDKDNWWSAYLLSNKGKESNLPKFIPDLEKATEMHRLEVKRNSKATEKAPKQVLTPKPAPPFRRKIGVAVQDQDKPHLGYEFLKICEVKIIRPVMLLGILTGWISEQLLMVPSTQFLKCASTIDGIVTLASKFHCVIESDPKSLMKLHQQHLHPIVIFITTKSKRISKSLSLPPGLTRQALEMEIEAVESVQQQYGREFSDELEVSLSSFVDFSGIVRDVSQMVKDQQNSTVWDIDHKGVQL